MANFQDWQDDMKTLQRTTQNLKRSLNKIGGQSDTQSFRNGVTEKQAEGSDIVNRMAKRVNEYKRKSMTSRDGDKLIKQYNDLKQAFETVNNDINVKSRQYTPAEDTNANAAVYDSGGGFGNGNDLEAGGVQSQQELQPVSGEALSAIALAEERNKQVNKIAQDVVEIKEAFDDLNELVDEQQQHLDTIEANVVETKEQVQIGTEHLQSAEKNQIAARKKQCMILGVILIIVAVIVVPIVLTS